MDWLEISLVLGLILAIYYMFFSKQKLCPCCHHPLPRTRDPESAEEVYWGGWTCKKCGAHVKVNFLGKITGYKKPKSKNIKD